VDEVVDLTLKLGLPEGADAARRARDVISHRSGADDDFSTFRRRRIGRLMRGNDDGASFHCRQGNTAVRGCILHLGLAFSFSLASLVPQQNL